MIPWLGKIARCVRNFEIFVGDRLNDLQQLSLLALGLDLNGF
jgi:hypothetical protein